MNVCSVCLCVYVCSEVGCMYVCSEVGGRTQYRLLCKDAGGDAEQTMLHETVPTWVVDVAVQVSNFTLSSISL